MDDHSNERTKVFISYSHSDAEWLKRLRVHLKPLERDHGIEIWDDTMIDAGSRWREEIEQALAHAKVAVLLVSADFLASDFVATDELPPLLNAAEEQGATVLPLILSPSRFSKHPALSKFQSVNDPMKPLLDRTRSEQEAVLVRLSEAIEAAFRGKLALPPLMTEPDDFDPTLENKSGSARWVPKQLRKSPKPRIRPAIFLGGMVLVSLIVFGLWFWSNSQRDHGNIYSGQVMSTRGKAVSGAKIQILDEYGNQQTITTSSSGNFLYKLPPLTRSAHFVITAVGYERFEKDMTPDQTLGHPIILSDAESSPTPIPNTTPASTKTPPRGKPTGTP